MRSSGAVKQVVRNGLEHVRLAGPGFKAWERFRAYRARGARDVGSDGLPLPPPLLMIRVVGHADADAFERNGRACANAVGEFVARQGRDLEDMNAIMDFGCGCGRVLRHWRNLRATRVIGTDYNPEFLDWCEENLPFVEVHRNGNLPPLPAGDAELDLVYAFSVFTHLSESAQIAWMSEMRRVLKPGGFLFFTTKGDTHAEQELEGQSLARYRRGEFVATSPGAEGTNLCGAYASKPWVEQHLLGEFKLLEHDPGMPAVMDSQEIYLVRRG